MMTHRILRTLAAVPLLLTGLSLRAARPEMTVYKTRTCGCCKKWVKHMEDAGFTVKVEEVETTAAAQKKYGVPDALRSCHTATVAGYTVEGHVPASDVQRLLATKSKGKGLAVPGMPAGSPGMDAPHREAFSVLLFDGSGKTSVFQKYAAE